MIQVIRNKVSGVNIPIYYNDQLPAWKSVIESMKAGKYYELGMLQFIRKRYGTGGVFWDIGAGLGTHAIFFSRLCAAEAVFAWEPQPELFLCCQKNITANGAGNVHVFNSGLGKETKIMHAKGTCLNDRGDGVAVNVNKTTDCCGMLAVNLKFIKMDVDGMELDILEDLAWLFTICKPAMAIESITGNDYEKIKGILAPMGYEDVATFNASPTTIWECKKCS